MLKEFLYKLKRVGLHARVTQFLLSNSPYRKKERKVRQTFLFIMSGKGKIKGSIYAMSTKTKLKEVEKLNGSESEKWVLISLRAQKKQKTNCCRATGQL